MNYAILIPIYNEYDKLTLLKKELGLIKNDDFQIIIIDDGSTDGSYQLLKTFNNIDLIRINTNKGKGFAIREGLKHVRNDNVILMDGDLEVKTKDINKLIEKYTGRNICIGMRWESSLNKPISLNQIGNFITNTIFNIIYNTKFHDVLCCFKVLSTKSLKSFKLKSNGFDLEIEIMSKLALKDIEVEEVLIQYNRRSNLEGKKIQPFHIVRILFRMITIKLFEEKKI